MTERSSRPDVANIGAAGDRAGNLKSISTVTHPPDRDPHCCLSLDWSELATCARFGITCESSCARDLLAVTR